MEATPGPALRALFALDAPALAIRLSNGEPVLFPTDTLPALAARPESAGQLWERKARPANKPLILMGADTRQLTEALASGWRDDWTEMAQQCWPGAVTLVLPIAGTLPELLHPGGSSIGLRVPACSTARALLRLCGPLATTSANRSGELPATNEADAAGRFPDLPLLAPLPWPRGSGAASTVIAWSEGCGWQVLRRGEVLPGGVPEG